MIRKTLKKTSSHKKLKDFINAGGGLIILGGYFSFGEGGYKDEKIQKFMPVLPENVYDIVKIRKPSRIIAGKCSKEILSKVDLKKPAYFFWKHKVKVNPKSKVILFGSDGTPFLVVKRFGKGRVAAFPVPPFGLSNKKTPGFWEWEEMPLLMENVLRWVQNEN